MEKVVKEVITVAKFLYSIDVQSEYRLVYFDEDKFERVEVPESDYVDTCFVRNIYVENDVLYIEFEFLN